MRDLIKSEQEHSKLVDEFNNFCKSHLRNFVEAWVAEDYDVANKTWEKPKILIRVDHYKQPTKQEISQFLMKLGDEQIDLRTVKIISSDLGIGVWQNIIWEKV